MSFKEQMIALLTIVHKEVSRFFRIWQQSLFPPIITTSLYFVIFGNLIGPRIGSMAGFTYIDFIVPGLILMAVITNSYANVSSSFYSAKFQHSIEEIMLSPAPNYVILLGYILGGVARGFLVGILVTLVSLAFTPLQIADFFIFSSMLFLTAVLFSLAGLVNGIFAKSFDDISVIPTFVLTPLTYLGGVFYSIELLPEFWQNASHINPILYMVSAFRYGFLGIADIPLFYSYLMVSIFILILTWFCYALLNKGYGIRS